MNLKKAKMIRQAMRAHGIDAREAKYSSELPYVSSWFIQNPLTKQNMKQTAKPLTLVDVCGRNQYNRIKASYANQKSYRAR